MKTQPNILYEDGKLFFVEVPEKPKELIDARTKPDHILIKIEDAYKFALSEAIKNKMEIVNPEIIMKNGEPLKDVKPSLINGELYPWVGTWEKQWQVKSATGATYTYVSCTEKYAKEHPGFFPREVVILSLPEQGHEDWRKKVNEARSSAHSFTESSETSQQDKLPSYGKSTTVVPSLKTEKPATLYTYFKIEFEDTSLDYGCTIVENISDIQDYIQAAEIDLDDNLRKARVIITGIPMTRKQFSDWFKENVKP